MNEKEIFQNDIDKMYLNDYREENSSALNPDHVLPGNTAAETGTESSTLGVGAGPVPARSSDNETAKELVRQVVQSERELTLDVFGCSAVDYVNTMLPNGAPEGSRHKFALKVASDAIILFDGDLERVRRLLLSFQCPASLPSNQTCISLPFLQINPAADQRGGHLQRLHRLAHVMHPHHARARNRRPDRNREIAGKVLAARLLAHKPLDDALAARADEDSPPLRQLGYRPQDFQIFLAGRAKADHRVEVKPPHIQGDSPRENGDSPL